MPKRKHHVLSRWDNLKNDTGKHSDRPPLRKRQKLRDSDEKENETPSMSERSTVEPPAILLDLLASSKNGFLSETTASAVQSHNSSAIGFFHLKLSTPDIPADSPESFYHQFPVILEQTERVAMDDLVQDDGSVSHFQNRSAGMHAGDADFEDDFIEYRGTGNNDSGVSDISARVSKLLDPSQCAGKLREAFSMVQTTEALVDLEKILRGESRGKGGGYKDSGFDKYVRSQMEGIQTFLSLYTDPRSKTCGEWGSSALQAAVALH